MIRHGSWLLALVVMSSTASAQSTRERLDALESRVTQTEQLLQGSALAELSTRIDQLESQLRALRGELETQANEQAALRKQLTDLAGELDRRLVAAPVPVAVPATVATASPPAAAAPAAAAAAAAATSPASTAPKAAPAAAEPDTLGPVQRYQLAFEALRAADYPKAIAGFDDMIARYPDHALATNARYWLGRSLVLQQDHARAVESARVPDAMLRKAQSELQLGRRDAASATLQQLIERFPDSEPARQARGLLTQAGTAR
jgi:TolA-binding protein